MNTACNMVERVARAIFEQGLGHGNIPWDLRPQAFHDQMRLEARAAIQAMREPTRAMIEACGNHAVGKIMWRQMIDEARSEQN